MTGSGGILIAGKGKDVTAWRGVSQGHGTEVGSMARVTGLEPATSGVTGRHSNRLSYTRAFGFLKARLDKT